MVRMRKLLPLSVMSTLKVRLSAVICVTSTFGPRSSAKPTSLPGRRVPATVAADPSEKDTAAVNTAGASNGWAAFFWSVNLRSVMVSCTSDLASGLGVVGHRYRYDLVGRQDLDPLAADLEVLLGLRLEATLQRVEAVLVDPLDRRGRDPVVVVYLVLRVAANGVRRRVLGLHPPAQVADRVADGDVDMLLYLVLRILGQQLGTDRVEFALRGVVRRIEPIGTLDGDVAQPRDRLDLLARPHRDDGLHPGGVEERVAQIVAVQLQQPTQRSAERSRPGIVGDEVLSVGLVVGPPHDGAVDAVGDRRPADG